MRRVFPPLIMLPLRRRLPGKIGQQASHHLREPGPVPSCPKSTRRLREAIRCCQAHRTSLTLRVSEGPLVGEPEHVRAGRQLGFQEGTWAITGQSASSHPQR